MKKNLFRSGFNLIEVTMAIAIVGIGIAGVMALFPPAIEASKAANVQNFTGTVVDNIAVYVANELNRKKITPNPGGSPTIENNWDTFLGKLPPAGEKDKEQYKPGIETDIHDKEEGETGPGWGKTPLGGVYTTSKNNILGIKSHDGSIAAHARIWKDNDKMEPAYFGKSAITVSSNYRVRLVIELSWPVTKPYENREKQEFIYEFNKPE